MGTDQSKKPLVPKQVKGAKSDTSHSVDFKGREEALEFFEVAKNRLLDVSNWHKLAGMGTASFALTDGVGNIVRRVAGEGDHLRIDIPGPGSKTGDGYDWVKIERIEHKNDAANDNEEISMRARPASNPNDSAEETAHFFKDDASSTFMVLREKNIVKAEIHGRNELPNVEQETRLDSIRNVFTALLAVLGFSKFQWKKLVKGIVSQEENK